MPNLANAARSAGKKASAEARGNPNELTSPLTYPPAAKQAQIWKVSANPLSAAVKLSAGWSFFSRIAEASRQKGTSWGGWRAILKGAFALPMTKSEIDAFRALAHRDPPGRRVKELWIVGGRRSGKDSVASMIAAYASAFVDYRPFLRPGEAASVLCLACDRDQAKIVLKYTKSYFSNVKMLRPLVRNESAAGLELTTGAELTISTNTFRSIRGRSVACAIFDEVAYWRNEESANPDVAVYNAIEPALCTIPGSMIVGISSPYKKSGLLYPKWRDHFGKDDDDVLVIQAATRTLNPLVNQDTIDAAMERDRAAASADWLAEWRDDLSTFIERELVESLVDRNVLVRPPQKQINYFAFADPSGGRADSFTLGVAHSEDDTIVLDCLVEIAPPFRASSATEEIASTLKSYRVYEVVGDRYGAEWVVEAFARCGVTYTASERDRSALYADALPLFTSGRARLLDNKRLVQQLSSLERRTSSAGRDKIDHPANGHADLSNAACGALAVAASVQAPLKILLKGSTLQNRQPRAAASKASDLFKQTAETRLPSSTQRGESLYRARQ